MENIRTTITKMEIALLALWNNTPHPEAMEIIKQFEEDINEIEKGN